MKLIKWLIIYELFFYSPLALGFQIRAPNSDPCHERITLSALDLLTGPYINDDEFEGNRILLPLFAWANLENLSLDKGSIAFARQVAERFSIKDRSLFEKYVIASFVAGVRFPDTDGLAVLKFNETRSVHIRDDNQSKHSLRRSTHNGATGNLKASAEIRTHILKLASQLHQLIVGNQNSGQKTRWTFAHYGEARIAVHGPAFLFGQIAHTIQDSYAHAIRDEDMRLISIGNYADIVRGRHIESEDGPKHSLRLDQCDMDDAFDNLRFHEAAKQSIRVFLAIIESTEVEVFDSEPLTSILDSIFSIREDCDISNNYCDVEWADFAKLDVTESISVNPCGAIGFGGHQGKYSLVFMLLLPLLVGLRKTWS